MGIRAALENVMTDKVGDHGTFVRNVDAFQRAGYLSERQRGQLDNLLQAGHAASHRGWQREEQEMKTLLDITESVIESVYLHDQAADALGRKIPPRARTATT